MPRFRPGVTRVLAAASVAVVGSAAVTGCATPARTPATRPASPPAATTALPTASPAVPATGSANSAAVPTGTDAHAPPGFVALSDVDATILQDIRYHTDHNFVGRPIAGYPQPLCILTRRAAEALREVQSAARARGYTLKVYDCYRPERAGEDFAAWARRLDDQTMKAEFYPRVDKSALFQDGYVAGGPNSHSRGSTMDLTLVPVAAPPQPSYSPGQPLVSCLAPQGQRFADNTIDMGTGFDCFDPHSHTLDPGITGQPLANRLLLRDLMQSAGFVNYANEWWHYRLAGEPYPDTYFDFPVSRYALTGG